MEDKENNQPNTPIVNKQLNGDRQVKETSNKPNPADRFGGPGPGRPKGSKNQFTELKESFLQVFKDLQDDKESNLFAIAKKHPLDFYKICSKMLPNSDNDGIGSIFSEIAEAMRKKYQ